MESTNMAQLDMDVPRNLGTTDSKTQSQSSDK